MANFYDDRIKNKTNAKNKALKSKDDLDFHLKNVLSNSSGLFVLKHIFKLTHLDEPNFTNSPYNDAYLNGARSVGLALKGFLTKEQFRNIEDFNDEV